MTDIISSKGYNWQTQNVPTAIQKKVIQIEVTVPDGHSIILRNPDFEEDVSLEGDSEMIII